jgi:hypothetical protein
MHADRFGTVFINAHRTKFNTLDAEIQKDEIAVSSV